MSARDAADPGGVLAVRLPNWLGDAVLALRALDALATRFGAANLALIARPWARTLFAARWPGARWLDAPGGGGRWLPHVPALAALHARTIVLFPPSLSARLHAFAAGVPRRYGLAGEAGSLLLTHGAPRAARGERHLEDEYLDLVHLAGAPSVPRAPLAPDPAAADAIRSRLRAAGAAAPADVLVIAPGARYGPAKRWPAERFAEVGRRWTRSRPGARIVLAGGPEDANETARVRAASAAGTPLDDWTGRTTLPELLALVAFAGATLANDSGVAHLAAAAGAPVVAVFGSTDPRWTAPRGTHARTVANPPPCSPCFRRECTIADRNLCLRAVDPDDAWDALAAAIRAGNAA